MKISKNKLFKLCLATMTSSLLYTIGIKCFVQAEGVNILSSGIGGLSVILSRLFESEKLSRAFIFSTAQLIINIPIIVIAVKKIGKAYSLFTLINLALTSLLNLIIPTSLFSFLNLNPVNDLLLIAVCSGILSGVSSGIALKEGLSTGGVDTIITYLGIKYNKQVGGLSILINALILLVGGLLFHEWVAMLYTIIEIFVAGEVINIIYRRTKKRMMCIVTNKVDEITSEIIKISKHGLTVFKCQGGYSHTDKYEIKTVVLESEVQGILELVNKLDEGAFVTIVNVHDVNGRFTMPDIE